MNAPIAPVCGYCGVQVGDNEYDIESRGYFSSHFRCSTPDPDGEFSVVSYIDGELRHTTRFNNLVAAEGYAAYIARNNRPVVELHVYDGEHDAPRSTWVGTLPG